MTRMRSILNKKGMTLVEVMITMSIMALLMGVAVFVFVAVLSGWSGHGERVGMFSTLNRAMEEISRDVREASQVSAVGSDEIRFTPDSVNFYIYYFYNDTDTYPPTFSQEIYQIRKSTLAGGINGSLVSGTERIVLQGVLPPDTSDLSYDGSYVNVDLSVTAGEETLRSNTKITPRNK